jgi:hypothetical protein
MSTGAALPGDLENFTRIKCRWIENYKKLYDQTPNPVSVDTLYPLVVQKLKTFGCENILSALDAGMSESFCIGRGYNFKLFVSDAVISRLLHKPEPTAWAHPLPAQKAVYEYEHEYSYLLGRPGVPCPF